MGYPSYRVSINNIALFCSLKPEPSKPPPENTFKSFLDSLYLPFISSQSKENGETPEAEENGSRFLSFPSKNGNTSRVNSQKELLRREAVQFFCGIMVKIYFYNTVNNAFNPLCTALQCAAISTYNSIQLGSVN